MIEEAFDRTVDEGRAHPLVSTKLHDFGFRGCTCVEQSVVGGLAHLLNFEGTDTMSAAYYGQYALNGGKAVACSVPATEHRWGPVICIAAGTASAPRQGGVSGCGCISARLRP